MDEQANQEEPVETADTKPDKVRFNWKRSLITAVFVILSAAIVGGVTWYFMNQSVANANTSCDNSVKAMQTTIDNLKSKIASLETAAKKTTTTTTTTTTQGTTTDVTAVTSVVTNFTNYLIGAQTNWEANMKALATTSLQTMLASTYNNSFAQYLGIQNTPTSATLGSPVVTSNTATVSVKLNYSGTSPSYTFNLTKANNSWLIDSIIKQ